MSGTNFRTLPFPKNQDDQDDLQRYIGCRVRWRKGMTVVDGILEGIDQHYITIRGLPGFRYYTGTDCLFWDGDGPLPKELFSDEEIALAEKLYEFRGNQASHREGPAWSALTADTKKSYLKIASDVLDWIDTRKCASCRDEIPGPRRQACDCGTTHGSAC